jgi:GNAT superfamily N-acetyltransferase
MEQMKFVFNVPLDGTMQFEGLYRESLRLDLSKKQEYREAGAAFIYLANDKTGELISETYCIDVDRMLDLFNEDEIPPGVREWYGKNAVYCYSNTTLQKYQSRGFGKTLKAYYLGYVRAKGFCFSIGHGRRNGSIQLNQSFGAEIIRAYANWAGTGEIYDFYFQEL